MASIAETLIQTTAKSTSDTSERRDRAIQDLAQLQAKKQAVAVQQAQIQSQKEQLNFKKLESGFKYMEKVPTAKSDLEAKFYAKGAVTQLSSVFGGMHPDLQDMMTKDRDTMNRAKQAMQIFLTKSGGTLDGMTFEQMSDQWKNDPVGTMQTFDKIISDDRKHRASQVRAETMAAGQASRQKTSIKAKVEADKVKRANTAAVSLSQKAATNYANFKAKGGEAEINRKLEALDQVIKDFEEGKVKTGKLSNVAGRMLPGGLSTLANKKLAKAIGDVNSAVKVKTILDSTFSDALLKETQGQLGIDVGLGKDDNLQKLKRLRKSLISDRDNAIKLFESEGLLKRKQADAPVIDPDSMTNEELKKFVGE